MSTDPRQYQFYTTGDGSPTLSYGSIETGGEKMHHALGAYSETQMIYGRALQMGRDHCSQLSVASVGLGLAYNEFLVASFHLQTKTPISHLVSFEIEKTLVQRLATFLDVNLQDTLFKHALALPLESPHLFPTQDEFQHRFAEIREKFSVIGVEDVLREWALSDVWKVYGDLLQSPQAMEHPRFNCILFDPYSAGADPLIWQEPSLEKFLEDWAAPECVFSTYACTGKLKRVLKRKGFKVETPRGFSGKRESTFAYRILK